MQSEAALYSTKKGHPTMQPQPHGPCGECDLMWSDYGHLTAEHLNLLLERDMATARADWEVEDDLNSQIPVAESRRGECRERIRKHEGEIITLGTIEPRESALRIAEIGALSKEP